MPRRKCPVCGSKRWHKESHSGLIACDQGHILQDYRTETRDAYDMGATGLKKRTLKSRKKGRKKMQSKADENIFYGSRGRYHHFQCLQLLLRKQIAALTNLWKLPPEFELACRDIWTLHLSLLDDPVPAEPYFHRQGMSEDSKDSDPDPHGDSSSGSETDNLENLLRENSESSEEDELDDDPPQKKNYPDNRQRRRKRQSGLEPEESLMGNVAVLVVACWQLRIPVLYSDFCDVIENYDLPYLNATAHLPQTMLLHLSNNGTQSLSPPFTPRTLSLHAMTARLARRLHYHYNVLTPETNAAPILWKTVRALGGSAPLYHLVKRISHALSLPLTLSPSLAPRLPQDQVGEPTKHVYDGTPPEMAFAAAVIIAYKLIYGLDGKPRSPETEEDLVCVFPRLGDLLSFVQWLNSTESKSSACVFNSQLSMPTGDLGGEQLDEYLQHCEKALIGDQSQLVGRDLLDQYFPLSQDTPKSRVNDVTETLMSRPIEPDTSDSLRPGQKYRVYFAQDVGGEVEPEYELVLDRAAGWLGVELEDLHPIIETYERRLVRWWRKKALEIEAGSNMEEDTTDL